MRKQGWVDDIGGFLLIFGALFIFWGAAAAFGGANRSARQIAVPAMTAAPVPGGGE